jgi:hypothetical protein
MYDIRTAILPFIFIFNTELLLIGVGTWLHLLIVIVASVIAMLAFAAGTQGYFLTKSRIWETAVLLLVAFTLFRPGFWWDMVFPPLAQEPPAKLEQMVAGMEPGSQLIIEVAGEDLKGKAYNKTVMLKVGDEGTGKERLDTIGLETRNQAAEKAGIDFDQEILNIKVPTHRLPKQLMFIPALGLLALIWYLQRNRKRKLEAAVA